MGVLCNSDDKFSVYGLGWLKGIEKRIQLCNRNKTKWQQKLSNEMQHWLKRACCCAGMKQRSRRLDKCCVDFTLFGRGYQLLAKILVFLLESWYAFAIFVNDLDDKAHLLQSAA